MTIVLLCAAGILAGREVSTLARKIGRPAKLEWIRTIGRQMVRSNVPGTFWGPAQLRVDDQTDRLCLVDGLAWKLVVWNRSGGAHCFDIDRQVLGVKEFYPIDCDFDNEGNFYCVDKLRKNIVVISKAQCLLRQWEIPFSCNIAVSRNDNTVFVVDRSKMQIRTYTREGKPIKSFGRKYLKDPGFIAVDRRDNLYCVDRGNGKVMVFDKRGRHKYDWTLPLHPVGNPAIAVDGKFVYLCESGNNRVLMFTHAGKALYTMPVSHPVVIAVDNRQNLYLAGPGGIQEYKISKKSLFSTLTYKSIRAFLNAYMIRGVFALKSPVDICLVNVNPVLLFTWGLTRGGLWKTSSKEIILAVFMLFLFILLDYVGHEPAIIRRFVQSEKKVGHYLAFHYRKMKEQGSLKYALLSGRALAVKVKKTLRKMKDKGPSAWKVVGIITVPACAVIFYRLLSSAVPQTEALLLVALEVGVALFFWKRGFGKAKKSMAALIALAALMVSAQGLAYHYPAWGFLVFLASGLFLFMALPIRDENGIIGDVPGAAHHFRSWELLFLLGVVILIVLTRMMHFNDFPFGFIREELSMAKYVTKMHDQGWYYVVFTDGNMGEPSLIAYQGYYLAKWFGWTMAHFRLAAVFYSAMAIMACYFVTRRITTPRTAVMITVLFTVSFWHIVLSRRFYTYSILFFAPLVSFGLLLAGMQRKKAGLFLLAGMAGGLSVYGYEAGRGVFLIFLAWMLWLWISRPRQEFNLRHWLVFWLGYGFVLIPVFYHALEYWDNYWKYVYHHANPNKGEGMMSYVKTVWNKLPKYAGMFHYRSGQNLDVQLSWVPILDPVAGMLFGVGLFFCIAHFWQPVPAFLLLFFIAGMMPGLLGSDGGIPNLRRVSLALSAVYLIGAVGLERVLKLLYTHVRQQRQKWIVAGLWITAICSIGYGIYYYYYQFGSDAGTRAAFHYREYMMSKVMADYPDAEYYISGLPDAHVYALKKSFFRKNEKITYYCTPEDTLVLNPGHDHVLLLEGCYESIQDYYKRCFPTAKIAVVRETNMKPQYIDPKREYRLEIGSTDPENPRVYLVSVYIPKADVAHYQQMTHVGRPSGPESIAVFQPEFCRTYAGEPLRLRGTLLVQQAAQYRFKMSWQQWRIHLDGKPVKDGQRPFLTEGAHTLELAGRVPAGAAGALPLHIYLGHEDMVSNGHVVNEQQNARITIHYTAQTKKEDAPGGEIKKIIPFERYFRPELEFPYSVDIRGQIKVPQAGTYQFLLRNDYCQLKINDREVFNNMDDLYTPTQEAIALKKGQVVRFDALNHVPKQLKRAAFLLYYQKDNEVPRWVPWQWFVPE